MASSDSRSALHPFTGSLLMGVAPTGHRSLAACGHLAGAETGLSRSMIDCATVPPPLRRRVLGRCWSKFFTPSMSFAQVVRARLPLGPRLRRGVDDAAEFLIVRSGCSLASLKSALSWRFDGWVSPSAGHQLRGRLAATPTGLPPASRSQLLRTHTTGTPTPAPPAGSGPCGMPRSGQRILGVR
jgi:hypothetical protein